MAQQQIAVQDLDFKQLSEVKKQLDDVRPHVLPPLPPSPFAPAVTSPAATDSHTGVI